MASRLRKKVLAGRTVHLKVRFGDFHTITRSTTVSVPLDSAVGIAGETKALLAEIDPTPGVRLVGVSVGGLVDGSSRQLSLDDVGPLSGEAVERGAAGELRAGEIRIGALGVAIDQVRARFGSGAIGPAVAMDGDGVAVKNLGDRQWGPGSHASSDE